jgi:hypothetical protein
MRASSRARTLLKQSLAIRCTWGMKLETIYTLEAFASLSAAQAQPVRAARLWGAAEALREAYSAPQPPNIKEKYEREVAAARAASGVEASAAAWAEGRAMTMEQAIETALL